ncbi:MAG TPA: 7TM diverse intracellular signaling domain-containing protein [Ramlibacter sp.]|nr:7TM diverse intracellular signaling domain-containing protein [Ramlibacter sp.]
MLWLLLGLGMGTAMAQPPAGPGTIQLTATHQAVPLEGRVRYWLDTEARKTADQVEAAGESLPWAVRQPGQQLRIDGQALWMQFEASTSGPMRWFLALASSGLDRAQMFYRDASGRWVVLEAGDTRPVSQWPVPGRVPTFELSPEVNKPVRYLLRVEHSRFDFAVPMTLYSQSMLLEVREREQFLLGAYFGLAALIAFVTIANALIFRDRNFAAYGVYVVLLSLGQAAYLGVGAQHLWDTWLRWNQLATFLLPGLGSAAALWFVQGVTEPARFSRALDHAVKALIAALVAAVLADAFVPSRTTVMVALVLMLAAVLMVAALIVLVWTQGEDPSIRLIALGFLPVLIAALFPVARGLNLIPNSALTRYGLTIGSALEMPILFYALALRGSRRREAQLRASALPHTDALTGLADARSLLQRLDAALARARSQKHPCALLGVKIANHDAIGAEYGREVLERALVVAGAHVRRAATDIDMAARVGEREFALLLEGPTTTEAATGRAQQIVASGLRQAQALPSGVLVKFQVVVALLPEQAHDAPASLQWLLAGLAAMRADSRKQIRPLNF